MLHLITEDKQKQNCQKTLAKNLRKFMSNIGERQIGYPGDNEFVTMFKNNRTNLWFVAKTITPKKGTKKLWNAFGIFNKDIRSHNIVVEANIPLKTNAQNVAGFFAKEQITGRIYLLHTGKIGGGAKGVSKSNFLRTTTLKLVDVHDPNGKTRKGIVLGPIDDALVINEGVLNFANHVIEFKKAAREGSLKTDDGLSTENQFDDQYTAEFSGLKSGKRREDFDYYTYHGIIVDNLVRYRKGQGLYEGEHISNDAKIDLKVIKNGKITEIYEVKTSSVRQVLYTAIGQLMTHSCGKAAINKRTLVIPKSSPLDSDFRLTLSEHNIKVQYFNLKRTKHKINVDFLD
ncbi:MAG: hypothetical protein ABJO57_04545 [Lentilitoribacter sp.]